MRIAISIILIMIVQVCYSCDEPMGPDVAMEDVAVSAADRLRDYKEFSRYPDQSRPAVGETPELAEWPGMNKARATGARIIAWDGDEVREGSLVVFARVKVDAAGRYSFTTVLKDAGSNRKLALSTPTVDLAAGEQRVGLDFYGLILREANTGGPFKLEGILTERVLNDAELERLATGQMGKNPEGVLKPFFAEHVTKTYPVESFTNKEYDSPAKRRKIQELEREVRQETNARGSNEK